MADLAARKTAIEKASRMVREGATPFLRRAKETTVAEPERDWLAEVRKRWDAAEWDPLTMAEKDRLLAAAEALRELVALEQQVEDERWPAAWKRARAALEGTDG